jgi:hypothetical protein
MAVVQLLCTCVLLLGLHPCVVLRGQRIRCGGLRGSVLRDHVRR